MKEAPSPAHDLENLEAERRRIRRAYSLRAGIDHLYFGIEDPAHGLRLEERYRLSRRMLARAGFGNLWRKRVLDLGCGDGHMLLELLQWGASPERLAGIDLRPGAIEKARERLPATVELHAGCATELPWPQGAFDLVAMHTVMSSILEGAMRRRVAAEASRVLAPGGALLFYDTRRRNPKNPDVATVSREELEALFPELRGEVSKLTFLPHVARRLPDRLLAFLYPILGALPGCRSHLLALLRREEEG